MLHIIIKNNHNGSKFFKLCFHFYYCCVANHPKLSLKQFPFIISQFCRSF